MASSAHKHHHHPSPNPYGATTAPPPTPSTLSTSESTDSLSSLLHRLPPTLNLSFTSRRFSPPTTPITTVPPLISLSEPTSILHSNILSASSSHGFFQLVDHSVSDELAQSAESDSLSLLNLPIDQKESLFPSNWPVGYDGGEEDEGSGNGGESFCFDSTCSAESTEVKLSSLIGFTRGMERVGMEVLKVVLKAFGIEKEGNGVCSLMWVSGSKNGPSLGGRMYPYVIGLQYQMRSQKCSMLPDSGLVSVLTRAGTVLVTLGDIAQVWCNGKSKKVRGRPMPVDDAGNSADCVSMTLLVTLPIESTVAPLLPKLFGDNKKQHEEEDRHDDDKQKEREEEKEQILFNSFSFEDYAWRIYHERLPTTKDPLIRYRV